MVVIERWHGADTTTAGPSIYAAGISCPIHQTQSKNCQLIPSQLRWVFPTPTPTPLTTEKGGQARVPPLCVWWCPNGLFWGCGQAAPSSVPPAVPHTCTSNACVCVYCTLTRQWAVWVWRQQAKHGVAGGEGGFLGHQPTHFSAVAASLPHGSFSSPPAHPHRLPCRPRMRSLVTFLVVSALVSVALASCPNACSGHGDCKVRWVPFFFWKAWLTRITYAVPLAPPGPPLISLVLPCLPMHRA
jgi:hypothetical protein